MKRLAPKRPVQSISGTQENPYRLHRPNSFVADEVDPPLLFSISREIEMAYGDSAIDCEPLLPKHLKANTSGIGGSNQEGYVASSCNHARSQKIYAPSVSSVNSPGTYA